MNTQVTNDLERGRKSYGRKAWSESYRLLSRAERDAPLAGGDLELLAMSAFLTGHDGDFVRVFEKAHHAYLAADDCVGAARSAFWLGFRLAGKGEIGPATGWLGRARRLLEQEQVDCVEQGYLRLPAAIQGIVAGDTKAAQTAAAAAAEFGVRFGDRDLVAFARHVQGRAMMQDGRVEAGLALLDEVMVAVAAEELSPLFTGLIYCSVIAGCNQVYALGRARQWTHALARWCGEQEDIAAFTASCLVHRAEVMRLDGAWPQALREAQRAFDRFHSGSGQEPPSAALYLQADMHRLRGQFAAADETYRRASQFGRDPQPGLALLRLAQGRTDVATASIRRAISASTGVLQRAKLLPAYVEILLTAGDLEEAGTACSELQQIAIAFKSGPLSAAAAQARGAVLLADGDAPSALRALRHAFEEWQELGAPYELARTRILVGLACRAVGDDEGAALELDAARSVFEGLGAVPDIARMDALDPLSDANRPAGLTRREREVLKLVAEGKTNKSVAAELGLSERTVDRHVSNIFDKLGVPSRTAATACAYRRKLL
jgi:DNA-binding CsgD family transcriptional regulator